MQVLTDRMDVGTKEFIEFQAMILKESNKRSSHQKMQLELLGRKFKLKDSL